MLSLGLIGSPSRSLLPKLFIYLYSHPQLACTTRVRPGVAVLTALALESGSGIAGPSENSGRFATAERLTPRSQCTVTEVAAGNVAESIVGNE